MTDEELEKLAAEYSRKKCGHYSTCEHGAACKNCVMPDSFKDGFIEGAAAAEKQCAKLRDRLNGMDNPTLRLQCKNSLGKIEKALSAERIKLQGAES